MIQTNHAQNKISFKDYICHDLDSLCIYRKLYQYYSLFMKILFNYGYDGTKS